MSCDFCNVHTYTSEQCIFILLAKSKPLLQLGQTAP
jgi:hypothetical protein